MKGAFVVTGGGRGVGRAVVELLLSRGDFVVAIELDHAALEWTTTHPAADRLRGVSGDASSEAVTERAADIADELGTLLGWVNNAAVFGDAFLHESAADVLEFIERNLAPAVVGSATALRRFLADGTPGRIVNVSSHQADRAVPGALPYATAKAAIESLTRAIAVDYGGFGIRANAVALGTISTEREAASLDAMDRRTARRRQQALAALHPLGRIGRSDEAAAAIGYLLSEESSFVNGVVLPVDGGRAVLGHDPEARRPEPQL